METITAEIKEALKENGYFNERIIPGKGVCAIQNFIFTTGLVIGVDAYGYYGRYCFPRRADAISALAEWDGTGDPSGEWIKYKGTGGERSRVPDIYDNE